MNLLIIYSSTDGHTKIICEKIRNNLKNSSNVELLSLDHASNLDLSKFNKIVIGASIRYGRQSNYLYKFIKLNKDILEQKDTPIF